MDWLKFVVLMVPLLVFFFAVDKRLQVIIEGLRRIGIGQEALRPGTLEGARRV